jgi:hypothetical protein
MTAEFSANLYFAADRQEHAGYACQAAKSALLPPHREDVI